MKCMGCKKKMTVFEPQGLIPIYRGVDEAICPACSKKRLLSISPEPSVLMKMFSRGGSQYVQLWICFCL